MTISFTAHISVPEHVLVRSFENESVLLNLQTEYYHGLDDVGTRMWNLLIQSKSIQEAYETLLAEYDVDPANLRQDLIDFVAELTERGLVELVGS
jgi:DNA-directed RNA polymerase subunit H (RpoH/RPB5)